MTQRKSTVLSLQIRNTPELSLFEIKRSDGMVVIKADIPILNAVQIPQSDKEMIISPAPSISETQDGVLRYVLGNSFGLYTLGIEKKGSL
jgi:hypothetical protein